MQQLYYSGVIYIQYLTFQFIFFNVISQDVSITAFEVCIKDLPGISGQHEPITVDYAAVGGEKSHFSVCGKNMVFDFIATRNWETVQVNYRYHVDQSLCRIPRGLMEICQIPAAIDTSNTFRLW